MMRGQKGELLAVRDLQAQDRRAGQQVEGLSDDVGIEGR